jgi:predicted AAA+ superfamily ATPase
MIIYPRILLEQIKGELRAGKVLMIVGARRVGKTMLLSQLIEQSTEKILLLNGEDMTTYDLLKSRSIETYRQLLRGKSLLIIDEAQKLENVGSIMKLIVDHIQDLKIILTGSSAFELGHRFGESLTGRKMTFELFPLAFQEFAWIENPLELKDRLQFRMVFGAYPEVWQIDEQTQKIRYLKELATDYLYRDLLELESIRNASKLKDILRLIAFQIGKEVSNQELGNQLGINKKTVERYLDLLSKVFVIFKVRGFSKNLRKEIVKNCRWYFYDNGILNVFLNNFNMITLRQDAGALWENYCISERIKTLAYQQSHTNTYFWRTYDQQEIDWIEEKDGRLYGYEIKLKSRSVKPPGAWLKTYPEATYSVISPEYYEEWLRV